MDPRAILARILEHPQVAAIRAPLDVYGQAAGGLLARGLAFAALFALMPTLLLVLGLVGLTANDAVSRDRISDMLISVFPPLAGLIRDSVQAISDRAALTSIVAVVGVIWTVSGFYGALDQAIAHIYSDEPERTTLLRTARGFLSVILLAGLIVALIVLGSLALTLNVVSVAPAAPVQVVVAILNSPLILIVLAFLVVLLTYRIVPPRTPSWRAAGIPAATVGATVVVVTQAFVFLVPRLVGAQALAGSLASAFATLAWLSLIFQALLLGASWIRVRDQALRRGGAPPDSAAL
jgi:membrane protein